MPDPVPVLAMTTDIHGDVGWENVTVERDDLSIRILKQDGSEFLFDRGELEAALQVGQRRAA